MPHLHHEEAAQANQHPGENRNHLPVPRHLPPYLRILYTIEDCIIDVNWVHIAFKLCAYTYIAFMAWIAWHVLPLPGHWSLESPPVEHVIDLVKYFDSFQGNTECKIKGHDLHFDPHQGYLVDLGKTPICATRESLLEAMSNGGRIGFDTPYIPRGCHYNWYDVDRMCMIMERFDGVIFIGDDSLRPIYNGLNIFLRQDLHHGALQSWSMIADELVSCDCDNQFTRGPCQQNAITSSDQISSDNNGRKITSQYRCSRTPHAYLPIDGGDGGGGGGMNSEIPTHIREQFNRLAPKRPPSIYKHIPIIVSLSPAFSSTTLTIQSATPSLQSIIQLAQSTGRKTDILIIGPSAPGHVTLKHHKTNQDIWSFHDGLVKFGRENDVDVLGMWNLTVQATSWDGVRFGQAVALTQTMMVMNWLSRLETS